MGLSSTSLGPIPLPHYYSHPNLNPKTKQLPLFPIFKPISPTTTTTTQPHLPLKLLSSPLSHAAAVTGDSWEKSILKNDMPVLVEFYASWCGPCQMVHRVIDEIAGEYDGRLQCFVLNTDVDLPIAEDYEIKAVPVVLIFKNGEKKESIVGTMPKEFYVAAIESVLNL